MGRTQDAACLVAVLLAGLVVATPGLPTQVVDTRGTIQWGQSLTLSTGLLEFHEDGATDDDIVYEIVSVLFGSALRIEPAPILAVQDEIMYGLQIQPESSFPAPILVSGLEAMGARFTQAELRDGRVALQHNDEQACEAGQIVGFSFTVSNSASNTSDATTGSFSADTTNPPLPSLVRNSRGSVPWGGDTILSTSLLEFQLPDTSACGDGQLYTINSIYPSTLIRVDRSGTEGVIIMNSTGPFTTFTLAEIRAAAVSVAHDIDIADASGSLMIGFTFQVSHGEPIANGAPQTEIAVWEADVGAPLAPQAVARDGGMLEWNSEQTITINMLNYETSTASPSDIVYSIEQIFGVHLYIKTSRSAKPQVYTPSSSLLRVTMTQQQINDGLVAMEHIESLFCGAGGEVGFDFKPRYITKFGTVNSYRAKLIGAPPPTFVKNIPGILPWAGSLPLSSNLLDFIGPREGSCDSGLVYTVSEVFPGTEIVVTTNDPPSIMTNTTNSMNSTILKFTELEKSSGLVEIRHDPSGGCSLFTVYGFKFHVSHGDPEEDVALLTEVQTFEATLGTIPAPTLQTLEEAEVEWGGEVALSGDLLSYTGPGSSECDSEKVYSILSVTPGAKVLIVQGAGDNLTTVNPDGPFPVTFTQHDIAMSKVSIRHEPAETCSIRDPIGFYFRASHGDPAFQGAEQAPDAMMGAFVMDAPMPTMVNNKQGVMPWSGDLTLRPQLLEYEGPGSCSSHDDVVYVIVEVYENTHVMISSDDGQVTTIEPGNVTNMVYFTKAQVHSSLVKLVHVTELPPPADGQLTFIGFRFRATLGDPEMPGSLLTEELVFEARVQQDEGPLMVANEKGVLQFGMPLTLGPDLLEYAAPSSVSNGAQQGEIEYRLMTVDEGLTVLLDSVAVSPGASTTAFRQSDIDGGTVQLVHDGSLSCTVGTELGFWFHALARNASDPDSTIMTSLSRFSVEINAWPAPSLVTNSQSGKLQWNREMRITTQLLDFDYSPASGGICDADQVYIVTAVTEGAELRILGSRAISVTSAGPFPQQFNQLDLDLGNVNLKHLSAEVCAPGASLGFSFRVSHGSSQKYASIQSLQQEFRASLSGAPAPSMEISGVASTMNTRGGQLLLSTDMLQYQGPSSGKCDEYIMFTVDQVNPGTEMVVKQPQSEIVLSGNGPFATTFLQGDLVSGNVLLRLDENAQCDPRISSLGFSFRVSLGDPGTHNSQQTSVTSLEARVSGTVPNSCSSRPPAPLTSPASDVQIPPPCSGVFDKSGGCCLNMLDRRGECCEATLNAASECCPSNAAADMCGICGGDNSCSIGITIKAEININTQGFGDVSSSAYQGFASMFLDAMAIILNVPSNQLEIAGLRVLPQPPARRRLLQEGIVEVELLILPPVTKLDSEFAQAVSSGSGLISDLTNGDVSALSVARETVRTGTCGNGACEIGEVCYEGSDDGTDCCIADCPIRLYECPGQAEACSGNGACILETGNCACHDWLGFTGSSCSNCPDGMVEVDGQCDAPEDKASRAPILAIVLPIIAVLALIVTISVIFVMHKHHQNRVNATAEGLGQPILESIVGAKSLKHVGLPGTTSTSLSHQSSAPAVGHQPHIAWAD